MDKKSGSWFTRFKRKNENLALILVGLFIISLIVFIVLIASNHPWMPFKFNPEEYGTVSDWVMVIVTLVTAVFLYQTLRSQMTVQRDQEKINRLTAFDIRARYKAEITVENPQLLPLTPFSFDYLTFSIVDNNALDIQISSIAKFKVDNFEASYKTVGDKYIAHISMIMKDKKLRLAIIDEKVLQTLSLLKSTDKMNRFEELIRFDLIYFDNFEFQYSKTFIFSYNNFTSTLEKRESNTVFI
ncbi:MULTISPECIES: hypothetical protein [Sphingobacterium]|uniref:hypothetical protein n=1 Tax=Sphingobacterium TaxID=28453 RepID=UPI002579B5DA|nr:MULTISPECIES: hypothetical protein [Sphingobacterium]